MGVIRKGFLVLVCVILFFCLLAGGLFWTVAMSLQYKTIEPQLKNVILDIANSQMNITAKIHQDYPYILNHCKTNTEYTYYYLEFKYNFVIPCTIAAKGESAIIDKEISDLINEIYYREYNCSFWSCFNQLQSPFFLVSSFSMNYWNNNFRLALIVSLLLIFLLFFLAEKKRNFLLLTGSLFVSSALILKFVSLFFLKIIASFFVNLLPNTISSSDNFGFLVSQSYKVFWVMIIIGAFLIGLGIGLKIWKPSSVKPKKKK